MCSFSIGSASAAALLRRACSSGKTTICEKIKVQDSPWCIIDLLTLRNGL